MCGQQSSVTGELKCLCARCAASQGSCCMDKDILLTRGDLLRISQHVGSFDFYEWRAPRNPAYLDQADDPHWNAWTVNGQGERRVLRVWPDRSCGFLEEAGCRLPYEVRPLVCRLFPFSYVESGLLELVDECPVDLLAPGESLLECLDMDINKARRWHAQLYRELEEEATSTAPKPAL